MSADAMRIDCASVKNFFTIVWDQDKDGILGAGDKLVTSSYEVYKLTEADENPSVFARTLNALTGRMTRILKGAGLFSQNAYLAISRSNSTDIETLVRIGNTSMGTPSDQSDEIIDIASGKCDGARGILMKNWFHEDQASLVRTAMALTGLEYGGCR
jgi:hypothetical protein